MTVMGDALAVGMGIKLEAVDGHQGPGCGRQAAQQGRAQGAQGSSAEVALLISFNFIAAHSVCVST